VTHPQRHSAAASDPVLITDAARSYEEDLKARKRRYAIMMGMRVPCMVLAAVFYQTPWLAVTLLVLSIPLPWMAVLIANDRRPPKREEVSRFVADRRSIEAGPQSVIDAPPGGGVVVDGTVVDGPRDGTVIDGDEPAASFRDDPFRDDAGRDARRAG
jgi:hypothetical protein